MSIKHLLYLIVAATSFNTFLAMEQITPSQSVTIICGPEGNQEEIILSTQEELSTFRKMLQTDGTIKDCLVPAKVAYQAASLGSTHENKDSNISEIFLPMISKKDFENHYALYQYTA